MDEVFEVTVEGSVIDKTVIYDPGINWGVICDPSDYDRINLFEHDPKHDLIGLPYHENKEDRCRLVRLLMRGLDLAKDDL